MLLLRALGAQADPDASRNMVVPWGTAALLRAAGVEAAVEPDRALLVLVRTLNTGHGRPGFLDVLVAQPPAGTQSPERVPGLLPSAVWQQAVFGRPIPPDGLAVAVLRDRRASFLYRGLFALDDETLDFVVAHPGFINGVSARWAAVFAAYSEGIRIRDGRVAVPGGAAAERAWETALGRALVSDPIRFVRVLFERNDGRLAQLFESLGRLDPPHLAFAIGPSARDLPALIDAAAAFDVRTRLPYTSWSDVDVPLLLEQVKVTPDGRLAPPSGQSFWDAAFTGRRRSEDRGSSDVEVTSAWLVRRFAALPSALRRSRLDALLFAQRLAARRGAASAAEWFEAAASFPESPMLFLTLEQLQAIDPEIYREGAGAASALTAGVGSGDASRRLATFQSAVALVARMARVGSLDARAALGLVRSLFPFAAFDRGRYASAFVEWIARSLFDRLPAPENEAGAEARLVEALAGANGGGPTRTIEWEGHPYLLDPVTPERHRLETVRDAQGGPTLDDVIELYRAMQQSARGTASSRGSSRVDRPPRPAGLEAMLAEVLVGHVYALATAADAPAVPGDGPWRRHDFGVGEPGSSVAWRIVEWKAGRGPRGSLLGLERALARDALRPTMVGLPPRPPALTLEDATGLAESVVSLDLRQLTDEGRDALAAALARGRSRLADLAGRPDELDALLASAGVDGIRRRLTRLAVAATPSRVLDNLSLCEVLELGQGSGPRVAERALDAWGLGARALDGSLASRMPRRLAWRERAGRPGAGLMGAQVADLHLRVAEWLAERRLPAALAKDVLLQATWDLAMTVQVANPDDWLPVLRASQAVSVERLEDYVSALAASGPLVPAGEERQTFEGRQEFRDDEGPAFDDPPHRPAGGVGRGARLRADGADPRSRTGKLRRR